MTVPFGGDAVPSVFPDRFGILTIAREKVVVKRDEISPVNLFISI